MNHSKSKNFCLFFLSSFFSPICSIMMTSPIITRHIRHAMTINASELVGLINSSSVQLLEEASGENTIS